MASSLTPDTVILTFLALFAIAASYSEDDWKLYAHYVAFFLYFSSIFVSFFLVLWQVWKRSESKQRSGILLILSVLCAAVAWYFISLFLFEDREKFKHLSTEEYIVQSQRFVNCYISVTDSASRWFISSQLLFVTPTIVLFVWAEGFNRLSNLWSFIIMGFLCAMSVCTSLFLIFAPFKSQPAQRFSVPILATLLFVVGFATVLVTPFALEWNMFKTVLIVMHIVLFVPVLLPQSKFSTSLELNYQLFALLSLLGQAMAVYSLFVRSEFASVFTALFDNHCQTSIGFDAIIVAALLCFYMAKHGSAGMKFVLLSAMVTPSVSFPLFLAWRERNRAK